MRGKQVLIVEPDAFLAGIYASKFAQEHMKAEVAESLVEARKKIAKSAPSAVLVDAAIENEAGFDFVSELRAETSTFAIPIFVLTDLGKREDIEKAFAAGATDYLIKGHFVPIEVVRKVKQVVAAQTK